MGRIKQNKPRRERPIPPTTHEPHEPLPGWPGSHVSAELTGEDHFECVRVTIHGVEHLLHATTARALSDMLLATLNEFNANTLGDLADPQMRADLQAVTAAFEGEDGKTGTLDDLTV